MPLIKDGRPAEDPWARLDEAAAIPAEGDVIVDLARWRAERVGLLARSGRLGVRLESDQSPAEIAEDLDHFHVIALEFPKFTDGRAYSSARLLRERYGYKGELRAVGNVLRDQLLFMHRCGFDAFEVSDEAGPDAWRQALAEISVWFQPTADGRTPVAALRRPALLTQAKDKAARAKASKRNGVKSGAVRKKVARQRTASPRDQVVDRAY